MPTPNDLRIQAAALEARAVELETQLTRADLAGMDPEAIVQARTDGRLNTVLGITTKENNV